MFNGDTHKLLAMQLKHEIGSNEKDENFNTLDSKGQHPDDVNTGGDKDASKSVDLRNRRERLKSLPERHGSLEMKKKPMLSTTIQSTREKKSQYDRSDDHFYTRLNLLPVI